MGQGGNEYRWGLQFNLLSWSLFFHCKYSWPYRLQFNTCNWKEDLHKHFVFENFITGYCNIFLALILHELTFLLLGRLKKIFLYYQISFQRVEDFYFILTHRTAGEGSRPFFIPLYHFHLLTNIQTFICNFACEMTITYF